MYESCKQTQRKKSDTKEYIKYDAIDTNGSESNNGCLQAVEAGTFRSNGKVLLLDLGDANMSVHIPQNPQSRTPKLCAFYSV